MWQANETMELAKEVRGTPDERRRTVYVSQDGKINTRTRTIALSSSLYSEFACSEASAASARVTALRAASSDRRSLTANASRLFACATLFVRRTSFLLLEGTNAMQVLPVARVFGLHGPIAGQVAGPCTRGPNNRANGSDTPPLAPPLLPLADSAALVAMGGARERCKKTKNPLFVWWCRGECVCVSGGCVRVLQMDVCVLWVGGDGDGG